MSLLIAFMFLLASGAAEDLRRIENLEGIWKFSVGDDPAWATTEYDDSSWDNVKVPGSWESNGYIGYNGYAWYRKSFRLANTLNEEYLFLVIGSVDDVDEVYVNGTKVGGTGVFPVLMQTAYNVPRRYPVPAALLNQNGENLIAVRVYDEYFEGGILSGPVGFYYDQQTAYLNQDLSGYWSFEIQGKSSFEDRAGENGKPAKIFVPGFWESLGYNGYDGYAVYSRTFTLSKDVDVSGDLYLILGLIDDEDEVFLNDRKIGDVEDINRGSRNYYRVFRGYAIPQGLLRSSGSNTLVVRVYDSGGLGGIYQGPVGITTEENYKTLRKKQQEAAGNYWEDIFKAIFD